MRNIAVMYGGDSVESDVSIISATIAMSGLSMADYKAYPIYIRDGKMWLVGGEFAQNLTTYTKTKKGMMKQVILLEGSLYEKIWWRLKKICDIDCALLATHGGIGENGGVQGLLEYCDIPYTSSGVKGSAICMDKEMTHRLTKLLGISTVKYHVAMENTSASSIEKAFEQLGSDVIVKPNSLGSSVGIANVSDTHALHVAVADAFRYDDKVLIEERVENLIELNCAIVRTIGGLVISDVQAVGFVGDFFDFEEKYINEKSESEHAEIIPRHVQNKAVLWTRKAYTELDLSGVVRIDYLYDKVSGKLYLNEINTIPGSLAYYLFAGKGLDMTDITREMIECAIISHDKSSKIVKKFSSSILTIRENNASKLLQKIRK